MLDACGPPCEYRGTSNASWSDALVGESCTWRAAAKKRRGAAQWAGLAVGRSLAADAGLEAEAQVRKLEEELMGEGRADDPLLC